MSATVALDTGAGGRDVQGDRQIRRGTIQLGTYAGGGITVTKDQFDLWHSIVDIDVRPFGGYVFNYIPDATLPANKGVVKAYIQGSGAGALTEVGSVDMSAITARFRAEGK